MFDQKYIAYYGTGQRFKLRSRSCLRIESYARRVIERKSAPCYVTAAIETGQETRRGRVSTLWNTFLTPSARS